MMKKIRGFSLILCACSVLAGCNKSSVDVKEKAGEEIVSTEEAEYSFPEKYERTSNSGKVKFNCELEVPENIKGQAISTVDVKGLYRCDREKAWTIFGEGKEIIEKPETPVDEGRAPEDYYLFANDESLDINEGITYGSSNSKYYSYIGVTNPDNRAVFEETEVSFKSGEECITELKKIIDELGYHSEDLIFACYPLNFQTMKKLEEQYLQEGYLAEEKRKESWSQEDDAYFIYGYQKYEDIPIFHEMMSIARVMAYDTPDNAPIQAIYSTRGIEKLDISGVYEFEKGKQQVTLKPFEDIAAVVEEKFENILNDADYEVTRAKFYERVYLDEKQKYKADPIWYFEVVENNISKSVTLINAETGKEIFLQ